jgi:hypothetical protein
VRREFLAARTPGLHWIDCSPDHEGQHMDYKVADLSLADFGRTEISLA